MPLEREPVLLGERDEPIGRGPPPPVAAAFGVTQLALLRLRALPVERHRGEVEQAHEGLFVLAVLLRRIELAQHKGIAAEEELMGLLPDFQRCLRDRLAILPNDLDDRIALAVLLDVPLDALPDGRIVPQLAIRLRRLRLGRPAGQGENHRQGRRRDQPAPHTTILLVVLHRWRAPQHWDTGAVRSCQSAPRRIPVRPKGISPISDLRFGTNGRTLLPKLDLSPYGRRPERQ